MGTPAIDGLSGQATTVLGKHAWLAVNKWKITAHDWENAVLGNTLYAIAAPDNILDKCVCAWTTIACILCFRTH